MSNHVNIKDLVAAREPAAHLLGVAIASDPALFEKLWEAAASLAEVAERLEAYSWIVEGRRRARLVA